MMESFDEIIKKKIEGKQYLYKPASWKSFTKFAKLPLPYSSMKIILISILSVSIFSTGSFFLYKWLTPDTETIKDADNNIVNHILEDTINNQNNEIEMIIPPQDTIVQNIYPVEKNMKVNTSQPQTNQCDTHTTKQPLVKPNNVKNHQNNTNSRILIINTDTIKSNY